MAELNQRFISFSKLSCDYFCLLICIFIQISCLYVERFFNVNRWRSMGQSYYLGLNIAFPDTVGMTTNIIWTTFVPDFRFVLIVVAAPPTSRIINVWLKIVIMCRIGCSHSSRAGQNNIVPGSTRFFMFCVYFVKKKM